MRINLIGAHTLNGVIGRSGRMPWHLPSDMAFFKRVTLGHTVIMGRRTYESIGRPLPGRHNILLSRNQEFKPDGVDVYHRASDIEAALISLGECEEAFVIGGAQVYERFLDKASNIYLTVIDAVLTGDAYFPRIGRQFRVELLEEHVSRPVHSLKGDWYPHRIYKLSRPEPY